MMFFVLLLELRELLLLFGRQELVDLRMRSLVNLPHLVVLLLLAEGAVFPNGFHLLAFVLQNRPNLRLLVIR